MTRAQPSDCYKSIAASLSLAIISCLFGSCLDIERTPGDPLDGGAASDAGSMVDAADPLSLIDADLSGVELEPEAQACLDQLSDKYPESTGLFETLQACVKYAAGEAELCAAACEATEEAGVGGAGGETQCRDCVWGFCEPLLLACFATTGCSTMATCSEFEGVSLDRCTLACAEDVGQEYPEAVDLFLSLNACATFAVRATGACASDCEPGVELEQPSSCQIPGSMHPEPACNACVKNYCCGLLEQCFTSSGCLRIGLCAQSCVE
jgi:hypothetical protein